MEEWGEKKTGDRRQKTEDQRSEIRARQRRVNLRGQRRGWKDGIVERRILDAGYWILDARCWKQKRRKGVKS